MRRATVLLALAALAAAAPAASAAPTVLGTGTEPWVLVDRAGTTHVAWKVRTGPLSFDLHYRRRPAGATSFGPEVTLPGGGSDSFGGPQILQDAVPSDRLVIVATRQGPGGPETYALTSADDGVTWSVVPERIYDSTPLSNPTSGRIATAALGANGLSLVNGNPQILALTVPLTLTPVLRGSETLLSDRAPYDGQVALDAGGNAVYAYGDLNRTFVRPGVAGPELLAGDYPNIGNSSIKIAGGRRGVVAVVLGGIPVVRNFLEARTLSNGALTPPVRLTTNADDAPAFPFVSADQSGRFHLVWLSEGTRLRYRRSEDGRSWTPAADLATGDQIGSPVVSAGADGRGWAVYEGPRAPTQPSIRAVPLDDPSVPDTTGIPNPSVIRRGTSIFVTPRRPSLATLRRTKCVNVRVQSTQPARIRVAIFSGRRSVRLFGATVVRFAAPGKRLVCIRVPLRAHTFDVRQPFRFAFAVKPGAAPRRDERPARLTLSGFTNFR